MKALLEDDRSSILSERVKKLEQQVHSLLSGAIVMPRSAPRLATGRGNGAPP